MNKKEMLKSIRRDIHRFKREIGEANSAKQLNWWDGQKTYAEKAYYMIQKLLEKT